MITAFCLLLLTICILVLAAICWMLMNDNQRIVIRMAHIERSHAQQIAAIESALLDFERRQFFAKPMPIHRNPPLIGDLVAPQLNAWLERHAA